MPTYEYKCTACEYYFEEFHSIKAEPIKFCPKCEKPVKKLISAGIGLIFKGTGFYITDYKNAKNSDSSNGNAHKKQADANKKKPDQKSSTEKNPVSKVDTKDSKK